MRCNYLFIIKSLLVFSVLSLLLSCTEKEKEQQLISEHDVLAVKTETAAKSVLYDFFTTNGNVRVSNSLEVYPAVGGRLVSSPVKLGQKISKGDVIAVIDPAVTGGNFSLYQLTAPISGTVLTPAVQTGSIVSTESRITVIGDLNSLQIVSYIPERYYGKIKPGIDAELSVEAYGQEKFSAMITEVSPVVDEVSRTFEVVLKLKDKENKIVAGMFADITIFLEKINDFISVPENCLLVRDGEKFVYVVTSENTARLQKIETSRKVNRRVLVESGLSEGDLVITEGYENLSDGSAVNVVNTVNAD